MFGKPGTSFQDYQLIQTLAVGGMARIHLAKKKHSSQTVVLKLLHTYLVTEPNVLSMFFDEIRLLEQLHSPHIPRMLHATSLQPKQTLEDLVDACLQGDENAHPFIALEYVPGCDLAHLMKKCFKKGRGFPIPIAVDFALQLLKALHDLHNARTPDGRPLSLVHRDFSPPNILVGVTGKIKVTDFGISLHSCMARQTTGTDPKGKFSYIAPELQQGLSIDQRADLFSWGAIFWEMLMGQRLFLAATPEKTLLQVKEMPIPDLREQLPELPQALCVLIQKALLRDREQRYHNAEEIIVELESLRKQNHLISAESDISNFIKQNDGITYPPLPKYDDKNSSRR